MPVSPGHPIKIKSSGQTQPLVHFKRKRGIRFHYIITPITERALKVRRAIHNDNLADHKPERQTQRVSVSMINIPDLVIQGKVTAIK